LIIKKKSKKDNSIIKLNPQKKSNVNNKTLDSNKTYLKKIMPLPNAIKDSIEIEPLSKCLTGLITIEYLYSVGSISKGVFETCNNNNIVTLNGLHEYIELNENFFGIKGCTKEESNDLINLHSDFYSNFLNNKKIEIKTTDSNRIREIKNIIIKGLSDKKNENDKNEPSNNLIEHEYKFDGYSFIINVVELEMAPLYWVKREGLTQYLFFNKAHQKSSLLPENGFIKLLIALTRTSLSFSDDSGDIFLNRLKNYLDLI
jgi:hypothetical protein